MRKGLLVHAAVLGGLALLGPAALADGILPRGCIPGCEPGYQIIQEVTYQQVTRKVCKMVPNIKKKWVYSEKDDPFCLTRHGSPNHGCLHHLFHRDCDDGCQEKCPECRGPYCRKQLIKRQVECQHGVKCVTEEVTEVVPVVVYKKVPCGAPACPAPQALDAPAAPSGEAIPRVLPSR